MASSQRPQLSARAVAARAVAARAVAARAVAARAVVEQVIQQNVNAAVGRAAQNFQQRCDNHGQALKAHYDAHFSALENWNKQLEQNFQQLEQHNQHLHEAQTRNQRVFDHQRDQLIAANQTIQDLQAQLREARQQGNKTPAAIHGQKRKRNDNDDLVDLTNDEPQATDNAGPSTISSADKGKGKEVAQPQPEPAAAPIAGPSTSAKGAVTPSPVTVISDVFSSPASTSHTIGTTPAGEVITIDDKEDLNPADGAPSPSGTTRTPPPPPAATTTAAPTNDQHHQQQQQQRAPAAKRAKTRHECLGYTQAGIGFALGGITDVDQYRSVEDAAVMAESRRRMEAIAERQRQWAAAEEKLRVEKALREAKAMEEKRKRREEHKRKVAEAEERRKVRLEKERVEREEKEQREQEERDKMEADVLEGLLAGASDDEE
jgi:hypothetical protein